MTVPTAAPPLWSPAGVPPPAGTDPGTPALAGTTHRDTPPSGTGTGGRRGRPARRRWRWLRLAVPVAVGLAVLVTTVVAHQMQQPDVTDPAFLNPASGAPIGSAVLAGMLDDTGVPVSTTHDSKDALIAARHGDTTLFIPAPGLVRPSSLAAIGSLPPTTRVVLVEPAWSTLLTAGIPVGDVGTRWAVQAVPPECALPAAARAGTAEIYHRHYRTPRATVRCYRGGLVGVRTGAVTALLAGAADPFRNDRIGEYGNAALAAGLLGARSRVVWLDLHQPEREPYGTTVHVPQLPAGGTPSRSLPSPPVLALLLLLGLGGLGYALARGRRLGPPVTEPLPVLVRGAETVTGRGRLYRRAGARGPALDALRHAALARLLPALAVPPDTPPAEVVRRAAGRTGWPPDLVDRLLYGPAPADDAGLVHHADLLDALVRAGVPAPDQKETPR